MVKGSAVFPPRTIKQETDGKTFGLDEKFNLEIVIFTMFLIDCPIYDVFFNYHLKAQTIYRFQSIKSENNDNI